MKLVFTFLFCLYWPDIFYLRYLVKNRCIDEKLEKEGVAFHMAEKDSKSGSSTIHNSGPFIDSLLYH